MGSIDALLGVALLVMAAAVLALCSPAVARLTKLNGIEAQDLPMILVLLLVFVAAGCRLMAHAMGAA